MGSNGYGNVRSTLTQEMSSFDELPPPLRFAINYAVGPWSARLTPRDWRKGRSQSNLIEMMRLGDRQDTRKTYGRTHPEALQAGSSRP